MVSGRALSGQLVPALAQIVFDAGHRRAIPESARELRRCGRNLSSDSLTTFRQVEDNVAALRVLENESYQQVQAVASAKDSLCRGLTRSLDSATTLKGRPKIRLL